MAPVTTQLDPRDGREISVFPRRRGPVLGATLVNPQLLAAVGFTDHSLERFAERTHVDLRGREAVEPIVRDLLLQEGLRVPRAPTWAHVVPAPFYLQVGNYLLLVGRPGRRGASRCHTITTVVAHDDWTWCEALEHQAIGTPPPPDRPVLESPPGLLESLAGARTPWGLLKLGGARRVEREDARVAHALAQQAWERQARQYTAARAAARARHLRLHGFVD